MKDLVSQDLNIGDSCYYINSENGQWVKVALVEVVEFKVLWIFNLMFNIF